MAKEVNLVRYWMPILRNIRDFRYLAKTEEAEIKLLLEAVDRALANMFIETADEYGIERFEKMLKIYPESDATLEQRRFDVSLKWNETQCTLRELTDKLYLLCGEGNFTITEKYNEYLLEIITNLGVKGSFERVAELLLKILPCNLVLNLENHLTVNSETSLVNIVSVASTAFSYLITNDIKENVSTSKECIVVMPPAISTATTLSFTVFHEFEAVLGSTTVLGSTIL